MLETDPIHCNKHTRTHTHLQVQTFLPTARKWWLSCQLQLHKRLQPNSSSSSSTLRLILQHDWSSRLLLLLLLLQLKLLFHQNTHGTTRERERAIITRDHMRDKEGGREYGDVKQGMKYSRCFLLQLSSNWNQKTKKQETQKPHQQQQQQLQNLHYKRTEIRVRAVGK